MNGRRNARTELFASLPVRAIGDQRLSARHFRLLAAIAYHDRLGRNGQGCWAGRKRLGEMTGMSGTHVSDMLGDLRRFGYLTSERHPMNRRTTIHRVIYDHSNRSQIQDPLPGAPTANRSRLQVEQVPSENIKPLNGNGNDLSNILEENKDIKGLGVEDRRDCAEARTAEKAKTEIAEAESYLSEVTSLAADQTTINCLIGERAALSKIADSEHLPETIRALAAQLRDRAAELGRR